MDSTTATTYEGRHRDGSARSQDDASLRDYSARWFGHTYTPRHSAGHREVTR